MTIINSVIIGGGSGDEVEAYALGDAKNAVKDDKVTLNFSANMATLEPSLSRGPSSSPYYPGAVSLVVGKYLYALNTVSSSSTVVIWEKDSEGNFVNGFTTYLESGRNTYTKPIGPGVRLSYYGKIHQFTEFGKVFDVTTSGSTDSGYVCASMSQDGNVIMAQYPSDLSPILLTKESGLFIKRSGLNNPSSVQGFWAFTGKKEGSKYYAYVTGRGGTGLKYVCLDVATSTIELLSTHTVQTMSEYYKSPVCFKNKLICYNSVDSYKAEVFTFTDDGSLTFREEDSASLRAVVSRNRLVMGVGFVQDGYLICSDNIVGYNQTRIDYKEGVGFFEVASPFQDKEGGNVNYIGEGYAIWCNMTVLPDSSGNSFIRRYVSPVEQSYVATEPITGQFYANQTLTGIVKENNNGVLKVSTVEDPNNPPPAVPDEAGLKTTINYGSPTLKTNYTVVGSPTISGATVTDFATSSYVQSNATVGGSSGTIEYYTAFTIRDMSAIESNSWNTIIDTVPHSTQKGMTLWIASDVKTLCLSARSSSTTYVDAPGHSALVEGVKYFAKAVYDGSTWKTYLSTSGHDDYNPFMPEGEVACSFYPTQQTLTVGRDTIFGGLYNVGSSLEVDLAETKVVVNGVVQWVGTEKDFGSVSVGYGYFKNNYSYPLGGSASEDKYVSYEGGLLTEDNIQGRKATTMNIILARNADMGSWTSDTKGVLSAQYPINIGASKKLSTPVYLWHDYSYITPAIPETIEPEVVSGTGEFTPNVTIVGDPIIDGSNVSGFSPTSYVQCGTAYKSTNNAKYVVEFTTGNSVSNKQPFLHCDYLFALSFENDTMVSYSWGNSANATVLSIPSPNTRYRVELVANGTNRTITSTNLSSGESNTITQADSRIDLSAAYNICFGAFSTGSTSGYFEGTIHLDACYIDINDVRVWDGVVYSTGTVSLPASWKTLDGVVYEYPEGFPTTQASELEANVVEGSNNLYATRTGDSCGLAISSTSPAGVDSSAVIGTVDLDANGGITSYTPNE